MAINRIRGRLVRAVNEMRLKSIHRDFWDKNMEILMQNYKYVPTFNEAKNAVAFMQERGVNIELDEGENEGTRVLIDEYVKKRSSKLFASAMSGKEPAKLAEILGLHYTIPSE